jgi:hypothetical protein
MSIVYIVQEPLRRDPESGVLVPRINYGTITPFGTPRFIFSWGEITDNMELDDLTMQRFIDRARDALRDFSDDDYLVPMGHPALIAAATVAAADRNERIRMLDWSRERRGYRVASMDFA